MNLSIAKYGQAPYTNVLVHGGLGAAGSLRPLAEKIAVFSGVVDCIQTQYSISSLISELYDQIKTINLKKITLIGHSWGAWLSVIFTAHYPHAVKKLILIGSGSFDPGIKVNTELRMKRLSKTERNELDDLSRHITQNNLQDSEFGRFGQLISKADAYQFNEKGFEKHCYNYRQFLSVWPEAEYWRRSGKLIQVLNKIHCPVVAFHGEQDPHPAAGVIPVLEQNLDNFSYHILPECGHSPWNEKYAKKNFLLLLKKEIAE